MVRISGVNLTNFGSNGSLYTKRDQIDNSEIYINSKLAALYERAIAQSFAASRLSSIRKFTDGNKMDKIV
ncbi:hypothetical protein tpqmel_0173 [Candidatus Gastranaerophilus sp. (ex Termes propinquus)]|nr:hypothetical protein tpqmel_0173 [Candidatus Gastranaerophilus sp. (ex Termes propinquus)]